MSALDAFYSTWSNARETFGQGTPQDGTQFDASSRFQQAKSAVEAAAPGPNWQGPASEAYGSKNKEHAGVFGKLAELDKRVATEVTSAANVVTSGRQKLDQVKSWVTSMANSIPSDTSATDRDSKLLKIANAGIGRVSDIVQKSTGDMNAIGGRVQALKGEFQALGTQLGNPKQGPIDPNKRPGDEKKDGEGKGDKKDADEKDLTDAKKQAQQDVQATLRGDKAAAERVQRVLNTIGDDQLSGQQKLDATQGSYLSQLEAQQNGMSLNDLKNAEKNGIKGLLGDSWELMSNPHLEFPKTELRDGALDDSGDMTRGGFEQLPKSIQAELASGNSGPGNLESIADIMNNGNDKFKADTDLDRAVIHRASEVMNNSDWRNENLRGYEEYVHPAAQEAVAKALDAVAEDHQVVHDALTGQVASTENDNKWRNEFKIDNPDKFMHNVTHEEWSDNGIRAGGLFDWTESAAKGPEAEIAAETAHAYSHYIGISEQDLNHLSGDTVAGLDGRHTLGQVNPNLVQSMAHGLTPYVNNIAGISGGLEDFGDVGTNMSNGHLDSPTDVDDGTLRHAKGVFSVLSTDPDAATVFNGKAYGEALARDIAYAQDPGAVQPGDLYASATLRGLVDTGVHNAFFASTENGHKMEGDQYDLRKLSYGLGVQALGAATGNPLIGIVGTAAESNILGSPPGPPTDHSLPDMPVDRAQHEILNAMMAVNHQVDGIPDSYYVEPNPPDQQYWRIATSQEMQAKGVEDEDYSQVIGEAMKDQLAQSNYMKGRYEAVTKDLDPWRN